jgi:hypothetical protein
VIEPGDDQSGQIDLCLGAKIDVTTPPLTETRVIPGPDDKARLPPCGLTATIHLHQPQMVDGVSGRTSH